MWEARKFPAILEALADGPLHLSAVVLLAPHLDRSNAEELLAAVRYKSKAEIERLLAKRFPRPDVPSLPMAIASRSQALTEAQLAPGPVVGLPNTSDFRALVAPDLIQQPPPLAQKSAGDVSQIVAARVDNHPQLAPKQAENETHSVPRQTAEDQYLTSQAVAAPHAAGPQARARVTALAPGRYALQLTIGSATHEKLRYVQEMLSHQLRGGALPQVLDRALDALIRELEKKKFAATPKRRACKPASGESRHIPADVKRAVWRRDGGSCTFVSDTGRRCGSRKFVEFGHVTELARGGVASISGLRLRCRAHNQNGAECTFGPEFMRRKREAATGAPPTEPSSLSALWSQRQRSQEYQRS